MSNLLLVLWNFFLELKIQVQKCFVRFHHCFFWEIIVKHKQKVTYGNSQSLVSKNDCYITNFVLQ